jgi:glycolate oxidase FAD binding subunit
MPSNAERIQPARTTIDGVAVAEIVVPGSGQECAEYLSEAAATNKKVAPVGGGTSLSLGNPPEHLDTILSTELLTGVLDYEPTDLVLSVGAGARFGNVQAILAEHGQRLPLDPPGGQEATIGGLIATGSWGPLRHSAGTLRDLLIGIAVAHPDGTVSHAGGMVVKNVSGYDLPRVYHGSLGTLGIVVSANFKVLPRPRAEATLVSTFANPASAFSAAKSLRESHEPIAALESFFENSEWKLGVRIEGRDQTVQSVSDRIATVIGENPVRLDGPESAAWWSDYIARQRLSVDSSQALVRCAVRPRDTAILASGLIPALAEIDVTVPFLAASPGMGCVTLSLDFGANGSPDRLAEAQMVLLALADTATILAAPPAWKSGLDVWGRHPDGFDYMRSLRQEFDPHRTINPGRFAGFL